MTLLGPFSVLLGAFYYSKMGASFGSFSQHSRVLQPMRRFLATFAFTATLSACDNGPAAFVLPLSDGGMEADGDEEVEDAGSGSDELGPNPTKNCRFSPDEVWLWSLYRPHSGANSGSFYGVAPLHDPTNSCGAVTRGSPYVGVVLPDGTVAYVSNASLPMEGTKYALRILKPERLRFVEGMWKQPSTESEGTMIPTPPCGSEGPGNVHADPSTGDLVYNCLRKLDVDGCVGTGKRCTAGPWYNVEQGVVSEHSVLAFGAGNVRLVGSPTSLSEELQLEVPGKGLVSVQAPSALPNGAGAVRAVRAIKEGGFWIVVEAMDTGKLQRWRIHADGKSDFEGFFADPPPELAGPEALVGEGGMDDNQHFTTIRGVWPVVLDARGDLLTMRYEHFGDTTDLKNSADTFLRLPIAPAESTILSSEVDSLWAQSYPTIPIWDDWVKNGEVLPWVYGREMGAGLYLSGD